MVRRHRPGPRGPDRLRPAAVPRHGPRPGRRCPDDRSGPASTCWPSATARAASSATRAPSTPSAGPRSTITNAYIVWALTESGTDDDMTAELNALTEQAHDVEGPVLPGPGGQQPAQSRPDRARRRPPQESGRRCKRRTAISTGETTSITGSGGRDLQIETTALAVLGLAQGQQPGRVQRSRSKGDQLDRQAARRLRRLRLDAVDHPGPEGPDRLRQGQQEDGRGRRTELCCSTTSRC